MDSGNSDRDEVSILINMQLSKAVRSVPLMPVLFADDRNVPIKRNNLLLILDTSIHSIVR